MLPNEDETLIKNVPSAPFLKFFSVHDPSVCPKLKLGINAGDDNTAKDLIIYIKRSESGRRYFPAF